MIQIVTGQSADKARNALIGIGARHSTRFVALIESIGAREPDIYCLNARNLVTDAVKHGLPVAAVRAADYYSIMVVLRLPPGRWRLELESLNDGRVAHRELEVYA